MRALISSSVAVAFRLICLLPMIADTFLSRGRHWRCGVFPPWHRKAWKIFYEAKVPKSSLWKIFRSKQRDRQNDPIQNRDFHKKASAFGCLPFCFVQKSAITTGSDADLQELSGSGCGAVHGSVSNRGWKTGSNEVSYKKSSENCRRLAGF